jgi:hypothetical protein
VRGLSSFTVTPAPEIEKLLLDTANRNGHPVYTATARESGQALLGVADALVADRARQPRCNPRHRAVVAAANQAILASTPAAVGLLALILTVAAVQTRMLRKSLAFCAAVLIVRIISLLRGLHCEPDSAGDIDRSSKDDGG